MTDFGIATPQAERHQRNEMLRTIRSNAFPGTPRGKRLSTDPSREHPIKRQATQKADIGASKEEYIQKANVRSGRHRPCQCDQSGCDFESALRVKS
nr:hypothetical protein [Cyanobacteriota bacterium]